MTFDHKYLKDRIVLYIKASYQWHKEGETRIIKDGVGLEMVDLEMEVLSKFGLPDKASQFSEIMQEYGNSLDNIDSRAEELIKKLTLFAEEFLLSKVEKDEDVLSKGRNQKKDASEVLPLIGINTSSYNVFLYQEIYCKEICDEKELITYLKKSDEVDVPFEFLIPYNYSHSLEGNNLERFYNTNLPFAKEFIKYLKIEDFFD